ncbi:hypothetical protein DYB37_013175, partial [Aphanomyces astaci]
GYTAYLPRDNATAGAVVLGLLQQSLVVPSTRYVAATWALYNPSSAVFTHFQVMFEISSTDHIELTQRIWSFHVLGYRSLAAFLSLENILMLFLGGVTGMFTVREVQSCSEVGVQKYTQSMWNAVDVLQLGCLYALVWTWFKYLWLCHDVVPVLEDIVRRHTCSCSGRDCFVDMGHIGSVVQDVTNISACVALVSVAIVFKYLRLNTRLNMLWTTLRLAAKDLVAFVVIFVFIFFGYAVMGFLLFGTHVREYRSLSGSLASCFQMLLGAFDLSTLSQANPVMAGLFFFTFMIFVFLIVVNMFIAILSEYYSIAQDEKRAADAAKLDLLLVPHPTSSTSSTTSSQPSGGGGDSMKHPKPDVLIEYDVLQQLTEYWTNLTWRVRLTRKEPVPLTGGACVLVVDFAYLQAERTRLAHKFRTAIRVIRICLAFIRPLRRFFVDFDAAHVVAWSLFAKKSLYGSKTSSHIRHADMYRKFPAVYVPLASNAANPLIMIDQLQPGDVLELDDGSLTFDRTIRLPHHDLETCVMREAIAFVERFDKALLPLDARELHGYKYSPTPTDTSMVRLPNSIARLSEFLAHNAHEVWAQGRVAQGWKYGPQRDNQLKLHPDL